MLVKASDVIGLKVLSLQKGKDIENVDDVIYDPIQNRIDALLVAPDKLFSEAKVIMLNDVRDIGKNAVLVDSDQAVKDVDKIPPQVATIIKDGSYLTDTKVVSDKGDDLGTVTDVYFDTQNGQVRDIEVSGGPFATITSGRKTIDPANIITVGQDAIIVKSRAEQEIEQEARQQGIQGAITQGAGQAKTTAQSVSQEAQERLKDIENKLADLSKNGQNVSSRTQDELSKLRDQAYFEYQRAQNQLNQMQQQPSEQTVQSTLNNIKDQALHLYQQIDQLFNKFQNQLERGVQGFAAQAEQTVSQEAQQEKTQYTQVVQKNEQAQRENAVGMYLTKNILDQNDQMIAKRGDMVTHKLLDEAQKIGLLNQVLRNISEQPVEMV